MTLLLEKALKEVHKLSPDEQDAIAAVILDELADDRRWDAAFSGSQAKLAKLAQRVRADKKTGRVEKRGIDEL